MDLNKEINIHITTKDIHVKKENIERLLGYAEKEKEPMVTVLIEKYINQLPEILAPQAGYIIKNIVNIDTRNGLLELDNTTFTIHRIIASQLRGAEIIAIFICTIGNTLEKLTRKLMNEGDTLEGYILDLMGSEAAEETSEFVHQKIQQEANNNGLQVTNRFSPGYCNWDVKEQRKLFGLFQKSCCGITLNESALMNPIKSVSGIIGIGKNAKFRAYDCSKCDDEHCIYRN